MIPAENYKAPASTPPRPCAPAPAPAAMLPLVACALLATASAFITQDIVETDDKRLRTPFELSKFYIPDGHCSAWLDHNALKCKSKTDPVNLNVTVFDSDAVVLRLHQLEEVTIYRGAPCAGRARVLLRRQCYLFDGGAGAGAEEEAAAYDGLPVLPSISSAALGLDVNVDVNLNPIIS